MCVCVCVFLLDDVLDLCLAKCDHRSAYVGLCAFVRCWFYSHWVQLGEVSCGCVSVPLTCPQGGSTLPGRDRHRKPHIANWNPEPLGTDLGAIQSASLYVPASWVKIQFGLGPSKLENQRPYHSNRT